MQDARKTILTELSRIQLPGGGNLADSGMVKAISAENGNVRFVIEAPNPEIARKMEAIREAAERLVADLPETASVSVALTAHTPAEKPAAPDLKVGRHPKGARSKIDLPNIKHIITVGSGKGGVGKSTVSVNLAVALARQGKRVGLLDADIYGPSQPRMLGMYDRPTQSSEKKLIPPVAHGVKMMSIGLMLEEGQAVVWRGPMLIGTLEQFLSDVDWGELDALIVDLPPGTGDVLLTLAQKAKIDGAIMVSTPQDVALIDARKGIDMLNKLEVPIFGLVENMSFYVCPKCGDEAHLFGHGGVADEARALNVPLLAQLPIDLQTRVGGDEGEPVATGSGVMAEAYGKLAAQVIEAKLA